MTRVKVCGITRPEDAELAVELGAWAIGFILWPGSPRAADLSVAAGIAAALRRRVETVGVFVNASLDEIAYAADAMTLSHVQLHGDEGPAFCGEVARRTGAKVIKAIRVADASGFQDLGRFHTDFHLLDTAARGLRGGTGATWDWALAAAPPQGSGDPVRRADGGERRRRRRRGGSLCGRRRLRGRGRAGRQGPEKLAAFMAAARTPAGAAAA